MSSHAHCDEILNLIQDYQNNQKKKDFDHNQDHDDDGYESLLPVGDLPVSRVIWNPEDRSPNTCIMANGSILYREPIAFTTDAARANLQIRSNHDQDNDLHSTKNVYIWKIKWPVDQRGTHAMVGVSTRQMPLSSTGYIPLVGNDGNSWALDLSTSLLHHNGKSWPYITQGIKNDQDDDDDDEDDENIYQDEEIILILDMNQGTLCYNTPGGNCLGVAFKNLAGKVLFPTISTVWGQCNIAIEYIGNVSSQPPSLMSSCKLILSPFFKSKDNDQDKNDFDKILPPPIVNYLRL